MTTSTDTTLFFYYPIPILLSFSLSFVFVINLFKKNIHSLFNLTTTAASATITTTHSHSVSGSTTADNNHTVLQPTKSISISNSNSNSKVKITDITIPPRIGFVSGDGLMSCTESLGFESSDERRVSDRIDVNVNVNSNDNDDDKDEIWRRKMMMKKAESKGNWIRSFPPPLTSLNRNGKPNFYLRPVRKDGRLELTEVRIQRPDILHASRRDGRLTLHLIPDRENEDEDEDKENDGISMVVGNSNERLRCHEMVNQRNLGVHENNHIRMCGISIV